MGHRNFMHNVQTYFSFGSMGTKSLERNAKTLNKNFVVPCHFQNVIFREIYIAPQLLKVVFSTTKLT